MQLSTGDLIFSGGSSFKNLVAGRREVECSITKLNGAKIAQWPVQVGWENLKGSRCTTDTII
jgi:hypothetical protein